MSRLDQTLLTADEIRQVLQESPLFAGLQEPDLTPLVQLARPLRFDKGESVVREGELATGFYIVVSGLVKVFKLSPDGKEHVLHVFGDGEPIGEVPVFSGKRYPANAQTLGPAVLLYFSREGFEELIFRQPQLAMNMLATLSQRLRHFADVIEDLSLKEVSARLARYLLVQSKEQHSNVVNLSIPKSALASSLGTISETLSRTFARLREFDIINVDRRRVEILDPEGLAAIAAGEKLL